MSVVVAIKRAKQIIDNGGFIGEVFKGYQPVYFVTNENISGYLNLANLKNKNAALTVLSSGDQAFSLATNGITNIDTFDVNILQKYIALGLKRAMIEKYSYEEFINNIGELVSNFSLIDIPSLLYDLLPYMDSEYQTFWKSIIDYFYIEKKYKNKSLIRLLSREKIDTVSYLERVPFLKSEEEYNKLRNIIGRINITFRSINAMDLGNEYVSKKYDFILLSNILSYLKFENVDQLLEYIKSLESISKKDGIIFLRYLYLWYQDEDIIQKNISRYSPFNRLSFSQIIEQDILIENLVNNNDSKEGGIIFKRTKF